MSHHRDDVSCQGQRRTFPHAFAFVVAALVLAAFVAGLPFGESLAAKETTAAPAPSKALAAAWGAIPNPPPWELAARRAARDTLAAFVRDFPRENPYLEAARRTLARLQREGALDAGYEYVPLEGGTFTMGVVSNEVGEQQSLDVTHPTGLKCKFYEHWLDETGSHRVKVPAFAMGRTEVTNAQYVQCVAAGGCVAAAHYDDGTCSLPHRNGWKTKNAPVELSEGDRPVTCIDWSEAEQVCRWLAGCSEHGCGLPTEARWEYAARGTGGQNRMYPWGDERDVWTRGNYCGSECDRPWRDLEHTDGFPLTSPVGSFPTGATPEGLLDMGGNVWEWVHDFYAGGYDECGAGCQGDDPKGPVEATEERVIRGGDWACGACHLRTTSRDGNTAVQHLPVIGVRCSTDVDGE
jgi:formylglycine-generating enzyme required for sulfatase activity